MNKTIIAIDDAYFEKGSVYTAPSLATGKPVSLRLNYEAVQGPPLHPACRCALMPVLPEEGIEPEAGPEEAQVQTGAGILQGLKDSGVDVAWNSVDDIVEAQWGNYNQSDDFRRSVDRLIDKERAKVRQEIAGELVRQLREQGLPTEQIRSQLEDAVTRALEELRPAMEIEERGKFFANWLDTYDGTDVIISDPGELSAVAAGLRDAINSGRAGRDAVYVVRNPIDSREEGRFGSHREGLIEIHPQGYVGGGILDLSGRNIATGDFYEVQPITHRLSASYHSYEVLYEGLATHEYGHVIAMNDPAIADRAAEVFRATDESTIKNALSEYAWTNEDEAAAEAYALYNHPDYALLPTGSTRVIEYIMFGRGSIE